MAGERVLVIDDGKEIRDFVVNYILVPNGFEVIIAKDGAEGLSKALEENPDFIIVDMQMPRMTGLQVIQELAQAGKEIPSILITAHGSEEIAVQAFRAGARDYIIKPFESDEILKAIHRALRDVRTRQEKEQLTSRLLVTTRQLEDRLRELGTLVGIGKSVTSLLNLELILNRVVEAAVFLANAEEGSLFMLDQATNELYIRAAKNLDSNIVNSVRLKVHDSLVGQVIHSGESLLVNGEGWQKIKTQYLVQSLLYVPIKVKDQVIGVLGIDNKLKKTPFNDRDRQVLAALADYAAIAIENARLFSATEAERNKLDAILRRTEDLVIVVDAEKKITLFNKAAQTAFNIGNDAIGSLLKNAIDHSDVIRLFTQNERDGVTRQAEITLEDDRVFNAHVTFIIGVGQVTVMRDITHLKKLDQIKSEFVSVVSHDLRSPLTAILGYVELLSKAGPINEMQQDFIRRVQKSVYNITSLIGDLLDLGRIEAGLDKEMETYHLTPLIRDTVEGLRPMCEAKKLKLELHLAPHLPPNRGNPLRLHQVINNLIDNAIKYSAEQGTVIIETFQEEDQIVMRVTDNGIGIPSPDQPYIFDKFYRSDSVVDSYEGTGLGLSIVKSVVERHQGRIWVDSTPGRGSTFTVVLPIIPL